MITDAERLALVEIEKLDAMVQVMGKDISNEQASNLVDYIVANIGKDFWEAIAFDIPNKATALLMERIAETRAY